MSNNSLRIFRVNTFHFANTSSVILRPELIIILYLHTKEMMVKDGKSYVHAWHREKGSQLRLLSEQWCLCTFVESYTVSMKTTFQFLKCEAFDFKQINESNMVSFDMQRFFCNNEDLCEFNGGRIRPVHPNFEAIQRLATTLEDTKILKQRQAATLEETKILEEEEETFSSWHWASFCIESQTRRVRGNPEYQRTMPRKNVTLGSMNARYKLKQIVGFNFTERCPPGNVLNLKPTVYVIASGIQGNNCILKYSSFLNYFFSSSIAIQFSAPAPASEVLTTNSTTIPPTIPIPPMQVFAPVPAQIPQVPAQLQQQITAHILSLLPALISAQIPAQIPPEQIVDPVPPQLPPPPSQILQIPPQLPPAQVLDPEQISHVPTLELHQMEINDHGLYLIFSCVCI